MVDLEAFVGSHSHTAFIRFSADWSAGLIRKMSGWTIFSGL